MEEGEVCKKELGLEVEDALQKWFMWECEVEKEKVTCRPSYKIIKKTQTLPSECSFHMISYDVKSVLFLLQMVYASSFTKIE